MPTSPLDVVDLPLPDETPRVRRADVRVLCAALLVGVLAALAGAAAGVGLAAAACAVVAAVGVGFAARSSNRQAQALLVGAALFGAWLAFRTSPWLIPLDVVAVTVLLGAAVVVARGGSVLDYGPSTVFRAVVSAFPDVLRGGPYVVSAWSRPAAGGSRRRGVLTGVTIAAPLVVLVGLLLASADPVFASLFEVGDLGSSIEVVLWFGVGTWMVGGLLRVAWTEREPAVRRDGRRLDPVTTVTILSALVALYALFAVTQVVAISGGADHVLRTRGLSYAEYARTGFFQLLAVSGITLAALLTLRAFTDVAGLRKTVVLLFELAVVLTLGIVAVAITRLELYNDTFGLTMLRVYCMVFAAWVGVVYVLAGVAFAGVGGRRPWLASIATFAGLAALLALNVANPERVVVEGNIDRARETGRFDAAYAAGLSDDAVPALVAGFEDLPTRSQGIIGYAICSRRYGATAQLTAANAARSAARDARQQLCRPRAGRRAEMPLGSDPRASS